MLAFVIMQYKIWGARGSLPKPETPAERKQAFRALLEKFVAMELGPGQVDQFLNSLPHRDAEGYGGHTSCHEVRGDGKSIIIDGGSGIKELGLEMMQGPCSQGKGEVHILLTHFHWDHLLGLPFFVPLFVPGNKIHFYAVQPELEDVVRQLFKKPFFPVNFEWLGSTIEFHNLQGRKPHNINGFEIIPYMLDHPDACWGYRVNHGGRSVAHCVDTEGTRISQEEMGEDLPMYQNLDLMVFDAQYTLFEVVDKVNWGHAVAGLGLDIAMREKIKRVLFVHHDPYASDQKIRQAEEQTRDYYNHRLAEAKRRNEPVVNVQWEFGREGSTVEV
ncbi:MAG: MBL fold metallo-hydrolase [Bdellovibrionales bacterium]|nr:MBL fold metallo-hydrolase [Bdellovibrionales bacterium]